MQFIETTHKYIDNGKEYTPVTYFIKSFQEYVDWDAKCREKAKKLGITYEELRAQWDKTRDDAASRGTEFHRIKEQEYLNGKGIVIDNTLCPVSSAEIVNGIKHDDNMVLSDNTVYVEKLIWSNKYMVCGQADLIEVVNGKIYIKDYKTNAELKFEGFKNKRMKAPINHMQDCNMSHYYLQLNTYMHMLMQKNRHLKFGGMEILHVKFNEDGSHKITPYPVPKLINEVKAMFEYFSRKRK